MSDQIEQSKTSNTEKYHFQSYDHEKVDPDKSLWDVAYEHVLPPHSDWSVDRCVDNILKSNNGRFYDKEIANIPKPCDPQDGPAMFQATVNGLFNKFQGEQGQAPNAVKAATALSNELQDRIDSLQTPDRQYNYLISALHDKIEKEPFYQGVQVGAEHWNGETKTWDNLYVTDGNPNHAPVRIAQPGNTEWGIANDRMDQLRKEGIPTNSDQFFQQMQQLNGWDVAEMYVGQAVKFPR